MKKNSTPSTTCEGTRYHRVVILEQDEVRLISLVSTPLTSEELIAFVEARIGNRWDSKYRFLATQDKEFPEVNAQGWTKVNGLATLEKLLEPFVPEKVLEEKTIKVTVTDKGVHTEEVKPATTE